MDETDGDRPKPPTTPEPESAGAASTRKPLTGRAVGLVVLIVALVTTALLVRTSSRDAGSPTGSGQSVTAAATTGPSTAAGSAVSGVPSAVRTSSGPTSPGQQAPPSGSAAQNPPAQSRAPVSAPITPDFSPLPEALPALTVSGNKLLRGGKPWWLLGYNSFTWSGNCGKPEELMTTGQVDDWFASMRHDGHGAVRLFFFPGWNLARLDEALLAAQRNNIYVTITLADGNANCGQQEKDAAWFADQAERAAYADHMTSLLKRYRGYSTIAWFEYFNEPQYANGALRTFYDQMGALAHSVDPTRLFASGTIAPYAMGGDSNFRAVQESSGVDISSLHEYDFDVAESGHGPDTRANSAGKPVIVGEFGVIDFQGDQQHCLADVDRRADRVRGKVAAYSTIPGYIGAFAWSWQPGSTVGVCGSRGVDTDDGVKNILNTAVLP